MVSANIQVGGNVEGSIVIGNNNRVETHHYHGTVIQQQAMATQRRSLTPQPPPEPEGFVGRARELQQVEEWIAQDKVVVVQGVDGIGKTSLIKRAANSEAARSRPDGVIYIDALDEEGQLLGFPDLVQRIFDALFESQPREKVDLTAARTHLSNTRPLVLLNAVALTPANITQLQNLFSKVAILITTENPALTRGRPSSIMLGPLDEESSLTLLASLTSIEDRETLQKIAALLEHVPAALNMVADIIRMNILTLEEALERLQSYTPREGNKTRAAVERAFRLLYSTLTDEEREMLDQVAAAFGVSVNRAWLESVCGGREVSEKLEALGLLHANSPRLRLMPGIRPLLLQEKDVTVQRERLLEHLLAELKTRWNDFEFIQEELGNLLGLLFWSAAQGQWANVVSIGRAIDPYLTLSGQWEAWRKTLGELQKAAGALQDLALKGWILHQLGTYEFGTGNAAAAQKLLEEAISIRKQAGDEVGAAYSRHNLQMMTPALAPQTRPQATSGAGRLVSWVLGGIAVLAIAAFLVFNVLGARQAPATPEPVITASEVSVVEEEVPPTLTPTPAATETVAPTATVTLTSTPTVTATTTASPTPTYAILERVVVNDLASAQSAPCFYGPGNMYLSKGTGRITTNTVDLLGRIETNTGIWVLNRFSLPRTDASDPCWMHSRYLDVTEEQLLSVPPIDPANPDEYQLPTGDRNSAWGILQDPVITEVVRNGDQVRITWEYYDVGVGEYPNHDENFYRYLLEAWLCRDGEIVFTPSGWGPYDPSITSGMKVWATVQDEAGCSQPSRARLYLAWAHGYVGPTEATPWPAAQAPTP
jgi:hypothetical protein